MGLDITYLAIKNEVAPGTYLAPTFAADACQVFNYAVTPFQHQSVRRSIDLPYAGRRPQVPTGVHAGHNFSVELAGAGAAITIPWWAKLLRGCLFGTATANASSVDIPLSSAGDGGALSLLGNKDTVQHQAKGMRGNAVINLTEKQLPRIEFSFLGLINGAAPAAYAVAGAVTLPVYPAPVEVNLANTIVTLDGFTLGMRSINIDMGMKTSLYSTTGARAIIFDKSEDGDRRSVGGTLVAELPDPAVKEYFTALAAGTPLALSVTHGTVAGNIIVITTDKLVISDITYTVENNRLFMNAAFDLVPSGAGTNELTLTTK